MILCSNFTYRHPYLINNISNKTYTHFYRIREESGSGRHTTVHLRTDDIIKGRTIIFYRGGGYLFRKKNCSQAVVG